MQPPNCTINWAWRSTRPSKFSSDTIPLQANLSHSYQILPPGFFSGTSCHNYDFMVFMPNLFLNYLVLSVLRITDVKCYKTIKYIIIYPVSRIPMRDSKLYHYKNLSKNLVLRSLPLIFTTDLKKMRRSDRTILVAYCPDMHTDGPTFTKIYVAVSLRFFGRYAGVIPRHD